MVFKIMENKENQSPMSQSMSRLQKNVKKVNESSPLKNKIEKNNWNVFEPTALNELSLNGPIKVESAKYSPLKIVKNIKLAH